MLELFYAGKWLEARFERRDASNAYLHVLDMGGNVSVGRVFERITHDELLTSLKHTGTHMATRRTSQKTEQVEGMEKTLGGGCVDSAGFCTCETDCVSG